MKNDHIPHFEDLLFLEGKEGIQRIFEIIDAINNGTARITRKYDGSPSVFVGKDPEDGKPFVAKKSIFNKTPIVYKSLEEIIKAEKLSHSLKSHLANLFDVFMQAGNVGQVESGEVYQGDLIGDSFSMMPERIGGKLGYSFQNNLIKYFIPGIISENVRFIAVWHTKYTCDTLKDLKMTFDFQLIGDFCTSYVMEHRLPSYHKFEPEQIDKEGILKLKPESLKSDDLLTYVNHCVRNQVVPIEAGFRYYANDDGSNPYDVEQVERILDHHFYLSLEKELYIQKLNASYPTVEECYVEKMDGTRKPCPHEGYVVIVNNRPVKFVNRNIFSHRNFSQDYVKGWTK